jgi:hypothetical protein
MPSEPPNDLPPAPVEAVAPAEAVVPAEPAPAPPAPAEPVSKVKEWAVAVAIMIVFALICAQFIGFLRSNQYGP